MPINRPGSPRGTVALILAGVALLVGGASGCATTPPASAAGRGVRVVAAEGFWGSLAAQLGGDRASVTSIIDRPSLDPHDYEPTAMDGRALAAARLVIINGAGYDPWATRLVEANPDRRRTTITVGSLVGVPAGGNPHRWYSPSDVRTVVDEITVAYKRMDPAGAAFFDARHDAVLTTNLKAYFGLVAEIRTRYAGTPVGASESMFSPLAQALGLTVLTPAAFLEAISEGSDPTAGDKATVDQQIRNKRIKVFVYNSQNATPDVHAAVDEARAAGIPVSTMTETPSPAGVAFQDWQTAQLLALKQALAAATGA